MSSNRGLGAILDWRPRSGLARFGLIAIFIAPLILSVGYMWSMWDPSKYLPQVRLAVVNEDTGTFGDSVVEGLVNTDYMAFEETTAGHAADGLIRGDYLFTVYIPSNFSEDLETVISPNPVSPTVTISYNDFNGTNGSVLTSGVVPQVETAVAAGIQEGYAVKVLEGLNSLGDGLGVAHEGSVKLNEGATKVDSGVGAAVDGIVALRDGAGELSAGTGTALDGSGQLVDGTNSALDGSGQLLKGTDSALSGSGQLVTGTNTALEGSGKLVEGQNQLASGLNQFQSQGLGSLASGSVQIDDGVQQLTGMLIPMLQQAQVAAPHLYNAAEVLNSLGRTEEANQILSLANQLDGSVVSDLNRLRDGTAQMRSELNNQDSELMSGWHQITDGSNQLVAGQGQLHDGLGQLAQGQGQLHDGLGQLAQGQGQLHDGLGQLADGQGQLHSGLGQIADGQQQLYAGTGKLYDGGLALKEGASGLSEGTGKLENSLKKGVDNAPRVEDVQASAHQVAVPVSFGEDYHNAVQLVVAADNPTVKEVKGGVSILLILVFGFLLMALASVLMPHVLGRNRLDSALGPTVRGYLASFLVNVFLIAVLAAVSASFGWSPANWGIMIVVLATIAALGTAMFQMLRSVLGRVFGGIASLVTVVYGVFSFGAVWPIELMPKVFSFLNAIHPMTYARDAFVRASDGIYDSTFYTGLGVMGIFIVASFSVTYVVRRARVQGVASEHGELKAEETLVENDRELVRV
ncbi:YhgE/Pip family protein [Corynebacterium sp. S7]